MDVQGSLQKQNKIRNKRFKNINKKTIWNKIHPIRKPNKVLNISVPGKENIFYA